MDSFLNGEFPVVDIKHMGVLAVILIATVGLYYVKLSRSSTAATTTNDALLEWKPKKGNTSTPSWTNEALPPVANNKNDNVWEQRRKMGIAHAETVKKADTKGDKPFGSSYYYAHNSTNAAGGYSDGLRMEDFTMNGPRLLSKNGVRPEEPHATSTATAAGNDTTTAVDDEAPTPEREENAGTASSSKTGTKNSSTPIHVHYKDITRYLWDDPGDASGIATIRIDTLPGATSTESLAWKDANIQTVSATLEGEGLLVIFSSSTNIGDDDDDTTNTSANKRHYRLQIRRLYDSASEVRTVVKAKRLLVKLHKKKNARTFLGSSNLKAWPHPQRKNL